MVWRAAWSVIWIFWVAVRVLLKVHVITMVDLIVVALRVLLVLEVIRVRAQNIRVRRVRRPGAVMVIHRFIWIKHGFVLMVVDHHPTDDTVRSGPDPLPGVSVGFSGDHHTAGCRRGVKRGREIWNRGKGASEETRGHGGALLGG